MAQKADLLYRRGSIVFRQNYRQKLAVRQFFIRLKNVETKSDFFFQKKGALVTKVSWKGSQNSNGFKIWTIVLFVV